MKLQPSISSAWIGEVGTCFAGVLHQSFEHRRTCLMNLLSRLLYWGNRLLRRSLASVVVEAAHSSIPDPSAASAVKAAFPSASAIEAVRRDWTSALVALALTSA